MRALLLLVAAVPLHVEPTITTAPAGSRAELGFTVEHGCAGSPTVEVAMQLPAEVADPEPVDIPGWTTTVEGRVVTWAGGPLPDGEAATFTVSVGLPATPGVTLLFPTVQTCEVGELAWIAEEGGESETDNPAPRVVLTDLDPTNTTSTTAASVEETTTTTAPASTTTTAPADRDDGGGSNTGAALAAAGVSVVVAGGLAYAYGRFRRSRSVGRPPRS